MSGFDEYDQLLNKLGKYTTNERPGLLDRVLSTLSLPKTEAGKGVPGCENEALKKLVSLFWPVLH